MSEVWLWDYVDAHVLKITTKEGKEFVGELVSIFDTEENECDEDDITIKVGGLYIGFFPSEIESIEVMDKKR
ncbi:MAG: hypothetical protein LUI01_05130 [Firmicutes bacterium]|nr:hypothetical protein [Bacillota bacterium]